MGNTEAEMSSDDLVPNTITGQTYVLCLPNGGGKLTLLEALQHFYAQLPSDRTSFCGLLVRALQSLSKQIPITDVAVINGVSDSEPRAVAYRWWTHGSAAVRWNLEQHRRGRPPPRPWLEMLERIGHDVLSGDVYFDPDEVPLTRWTREQYARWSVGDDDGGAAPPVAATNRGRARDPSIVTTLFPLLECHRRISGSIGAYWLLPMLYAMFHTEDARVYVETVACGGPPHWPTQPAPCERLPAGCHVRYHRWGRGEWQTHAALVEFLMFYQCHVLAGDFGSWHRMHARRLDHSFPADPTTDELVIVTVGGVPIASTGTQPKGSDGDDRYISTLCAVTHSGGGTLAVRYLQATIGTAAVLWADATDTAIGFYHRMGFVSPDPDNDRLRVRWPPPINDAS